MQQHGRLFFDGWRDVLHIVALAALTYTTLVVMLRASGKRTLAKMNVFDFVFVVALGSALASTILTPGTTLAEGVAALGSLILIQVFFSWLTVRSSRLERIINGEPRLLVHRGALLRDAMRRERVTVEEVMSALRTNGMTRLDQAEAVVLETDGTFAIVGRPDDDQAPTSLADVPGAPGARRGDDVPREFRPPDPEVSRDIA